MRSCLLREQWSRRPSLGSPSIDRCIKWSRSCRRRRAHSPSLRRAPSTPPQPFAQGVRRFCRVRCSPANLIAESSLASISSVLAAVAVEDREISEALAATRHVLAGDGAVLVLALRADAVHEAVPRRLLLNRRRRRRAASRLASVTRGPSWGCILGRARRAAFSRAGLVSGVLLTSTRYGCAGPLPKAAQARSCSTAIRNCQPKLAASTPSRDLGSSRMLVNFVQLQEPAAAFNRRVSLRR